MEVNNNTSNRDPDSEIELQLKPELLKAAKLNITV